MEIPVLNLWSSSNWIFLSFAYLTVAKLVQLRISVLYQISAWPQYSGFLSDLNLAPVFRFFIRSQLGPSIQVLYQISTWPQYSGSLSDLSLAPVFRFFSLCWIISGHAIHSSIVGMLPPTSMEPIPFLNSASKKAGLQGHAIAPCCKNEAWPLTTN